MLAQGRDRWAVSQKRITNERIFHKVNGATHWLINFQGITQKASITLIHQMVNYPLDSVGTCTANTHYASACEAQDTYLFWVEGDCLMATWES